MEKDYKGRFTGKADLYAAGRPSYADAFLKDLVDKYGFSNTTAVADVGSGTGKFTKQLLKTGCTVYAVEPNADMRRIAEKDLSGFPGFYSVTGDASSTGLGDHSVDAITVAQAFHWFPPEEFRQECIRIGRGPCRVFLIWNERDHESAVTQALFRLYSTYGRDFHGFNLGLERDDIRIRSFFRDAYMEVEYENPLHYNREGFQTRCLSSSHSPLTEDENYPAYIAEVNRIFDCFAVNGRLEVPNKTRVYTGELI